MSPLTADTSSCNSSFSWTDDGKTFVFVFPFNFRSDAHAASCERLALPARASNSSKRFLGCQLRATEGAPPPPHTSQLSRFPSVHNTLSLGKVLTHTHARVPPRFTRKPLSSQLVTEGAEDGRRRTGGASPPPPPLIFVVIFKKEPQKRLQTASSLLLNQVLFGTLCLDL